MIHQSGAFFRGCIGFGVLRAVFLIDFFYFEGELSNDEIGSETVQMFGK